MKRSFLNVAAIVIACSVGVISCEDDKPGKEKRPDNSIVAFSLTTLDLVGVIDDVAKTVTLTVPMDYAMAQLNNVAPGVGLQISAAATIKPLPEVEQDFRVDVKYTVTAENKTPAEWTVKLVKSPFVTAGIGQVNLSWLKTSAELGAATNEASIATDGDLVVFARSGKLVDGKTGELKTETLNMAGIECSATNEAYNIPFAVVNDDAGNLLGCILGAWAGTNDFKVYKWASASAAPVELISHPQTATSNFGRKLTAVGDVNGKAIVTSYDCHTDNIKLVDGTANHTYWKINGGVAAEGQKISTKFNSNNYNQLLWPMSANDISPFYFSCTGSPSASPGTTIRYVDAQGVESRFPKGPVPNSDIDPGNDLNVFGGDYYGFGNRILHTLVFNFNEKKYMAVLSSYSSATPHVQYYITILDLQDDYRVVFFDRSAQMKYAGAYSTINANGVAGLAVSKVAVSEDETKKIRLYGMFTGSGMVAYEISNLFKTN